MNCVNYRVYNRKGQYHHCYSPSLEGALDWAIDCAKVVHGSVREVYPDGEEKEIFSVKEKASAKGN
jgi:hypothetical protein|tara:strand:- start:162 stop:359 length:198 start_codon:yes stop_codon:yes gene_type:complete